MRVLVVNSGSSSLKLSVVGGDGERLHAREMPPLEEAAVADAIAGFAAEGPAPDAAGHRIVHGGPDLRESVPIDDGVVTRIEAVADLAPLHNRAALAAVAAQRRGLPDLPAVACFDTAFHAGLPPAAATYALPAAWRERWPIRRYGFHGLSHAYAAKRAAELLGRPVEDLRVVTCHLGSGASLAAVAGGRSVDTTMGYTPLEGIVMATRSGSVDPGLVLWLERSGGLSAEEIEAALEHESGVRGLSGGSGDMRELIASVDAGDEGATLALDVYVHRLRAGVAAMAAAMDGLDVLVFTGGVGEGSSRVRELACSGLGFLGLAIARDAGGSPDRDLSAPDAAVRTVVVHAREDVEIAREVRRVIET